jgi:hypothetical protein
VPIAADPSAAPRLRRPAWPHRLLAGIDDWCAGRWWHVRLPALAFLAYVWIRHAQDPRYQSAFKGLNLGIHELGHYLFGPFGDIPAVLGGSFLQCVVPLIAAAMFVRQRDWFAVCFAFGWLGTNFFEVATYAGDAVAKSLPLVTPGGGEPIHDWNYLLGSFGWLRHTDAIAGWHRAAAHASSAVALAGGSWIVLRMMAAAQREHCSAARRARLAAASSGSAPPRGAGLREPVRQEPLPSHPRRP